MDYRISYIVKRALPFGIVKFYETILEVLVKNNHMYLFLYDMIGVKNMTSTCIIKEWLRQKEKRGAKCANN